MENKAARQLISFDYALKYVLRNKANFIVLEGFLTDLFEKPIKILELLEIETNQVDIEDKYNRVDLLVKDNQEDIYIIELQYGHQTDYIERVIYGVSKTIIEHMKSGQAYSNIRKVISISIVYFPLIDKRNSRDSIFHNSIEFKGLNDGEVVGIRSHRHVKTTEGEKIELQLYNPFPQYYFIDVSSFHDEIKKPIDEWLFMFKNNYFRKQIKSTNIDEAEEALNYIKLTAEQRKIYDVIKEGRERNISVISSAEQRGKFEGKLEIAKSMKLEGDSIDKISRITGLTIKEINSL
jgi:predicted transposase/invertase (TIGR01784 family)